MIKRLWVRILSHPTLDGNGFKAIPGRLMYPILDHLRKERKYRWPNGVHQKCKNLAFVSPFFDPGVSTFLDVCHSLRNLKRKKGKI